MYGDTKIIVITEGASIVDDLTVVAFQSKGTLAELTRAAAWIALGEALLTLQGVESNCRINRDKR